MGSGVGGGSRRAVTRSSSAPGIGATAEALAGDFAPIVTEIVLTASPVVGSSGTVTNAAGVPVNTFADAANSFASWTCALPAHWATFDFDVEYASASGTGNAYLRGDFAFLTVGEPIAVVNSTAAVLPCTTNLARATVIADIPVVADELFSLRAIRLGNDVLDTLAATFYIRAVRLVQAS